jgi:hypothetical protein
VATKKQKNKEEADKTPQSKNPGKRYSDQSLFRKEIHHYKSRHPVRAPTPASPEGINLNADFRHYRLFY